MNISFKISHMDMCINCLCHKTHHDSSSNLCNCSENCECITECNCDCNI